MQHFAALDPSLSSDQTFDFSTAQGFICIDVILESSIITRLVLPVVSHPLFDHLERLMNVVNNGQ